MRVWSRTQESLDRFVAEERPLYPHLELKPARPTLEQAVARRRRVVTGTHARGWIVDDDWVEPGTHIAALGADLEGRAGARPAHPAAGAGLRRRHPPVPRATARSTCRCAEGLISEDDLAGEIGKVICGELEGRAVDDEVTVFDSTGIALQDSATVPLEYERAVAAGVGVEKKMIST